MDINSVTLNHFCFVTCQKTNGVVSMNQVDIGVIDFRFLLRRLCGRVWFCSYIKAFYEQEGTHSPTTPTFHCRSWLWRWCRCRCDFRFLLCCRCGRVWFRSYIKAFYEQEGTPILLQYPRFTVDAGIGAGAGAGAAGTILTTLVDSGVRFARFTTWPSVVEGVLAFLFVPAFLFIFVFCSGAFSRAAGNGGGCSGFAFG